MEHFEISTRNINNLPISDADMKKLFEGDIEKTPKFMQMLLRANLVKKDAVTKKTWPDGVVHYKFAKKFGEKNGNNLIINFKYSYIHKYLQCVIVIL